ncbi:zinc finger MYM-type protein 1-like [Dioscorea cayenensis subsp. rotundata]|uniref:Zinc finger MYM-type protein 1-like n=1 Tax=Dioscorea cayennensis subsp. rotundata TaxID=55577 RepID=A0AB40CUE5_DIOCR|nr:zinc finger MYM-type protein 1-like [Dioscorea cayenensis subsp. rotundata]
MVVLDVMNFLVKQGLPFRGHDESLSSLNKGNFLELLEWYSLRNDKITWAIVDDIRDKYFSLMIDEARDVSVKKQMGVILRYVNNNRLRRQGYNVDSNMRGEFNGLKTLVLKENPYTSVKARLQDLSETGWEAFLEEVSSFCKENSIPVPNMEENMRICGRSRQEEQVSTHFHHYHVEIFCEVIDLIAQEMQNCFSETSTELLLLLSCLDSMDSFSKFNIHKLLRLVELYLEDFTMTEHMMLED